VPLVTQSYDLIARIGTGPTGTVWQARHRDTGEPVAVKVLAPHLATDPQIVTRFSRVRHLLTVAVEPTLVPAREVLIGDGELALVSELVAGPNLREQVTDAGPFPPAVAAWIALDIARALDLAHSAGLVHGELKPTNVLFLPPAGAVRVTDARLARLVRGYLDGSARFAVPAYAAPEVILGGQAVPATDVYGLGLLLFEMLSGEPLCPDGLSAHLRARPIVPFGLPAELRELIEEYVRPDPVRRPVPATLAAHLRRLDPASGPGLPLRRPQPRREVAPVPVPHVPRPTATPPAAPAMAPRRHVARRAAASRIDAPLTRLRIVLISAAVLVVVAVTAVILHSVPSADGSPRGTAGAPVPVATSRLGPPQLIAEARAGTQDGASGFVRYWFAALSYATASGDTGPFQTASSPDCAACSAAIQSIQAGWQGRKQIRGGSYTVRDVSTDGFFTVEHPALMTVFDRSPRSTVAAAGTELGQLPGVTFGTCRVFLERNGSDWRVLSAQSDQSLA
jgi:serine/threonine-protein kinase